jgi:hypothetical protein
MDCFVAPLLAKTEDLRFNRVGFAKLSFRAAQADPESRRVTTSPWHGGWKLLPVHPGETLGEELEVRRISAETALRLGRAFGNSPEFWMRLQASYDLAVVERNVGEKVLREVEAA